MSGTRPIVDTALGRLEGTLRDGIRAFKGIPYGAPTGGRRRFQAPIPAEPWTGVLDASRFGPICPQRGVPGQTELERRTVGASPRLPHAEDCLVLNVWTPGVDPAARRPVMVWLHGRRFEAGAGSEDLYDGANLARRGDVVVVTLNHRLNAFGYLYLAELCGAGFADSGIAGLLDVVLALEWLRDNAAAFGGDPQNVTIFGESGGGRKVSTLLAMPSARGLFQRAIVQSSVTLRAVEPQAATQTAERLLAHLDIAPSDVEALQNLPFARLTDAVQAVRQDVRDFEPVVDGNRLPVHPFEPVAAPSATPVPLLIGTNKDEAALFLAGDPRRRRLTDAELLERLTPLLGERRDEILGTYRACRPEASAWQLWIAINSEARRLAAVRAAEQRLAAGGAPVFMYSFDWESDFLGGLLGASHAMEIPFVFDNTASAPMTGSRPDREELARTMSTTWATFARSGEPNREGLVRWPAYDTRRRATMIFDSPCRIESDPRRDERLVWKDLDLYR